MDLVPLLIVLLSAAGHVMWNFLAKQSRNKLVFIWGLYAVAIPAFLPLYLWRGLDALKADFPRIREIRGVGLMLGMEFEKECAEFVGGCLQNGLIVNCTAGKVVRLMPALNVTEDEADEALAIMRQVLEKNNQ